MFYFNQVEEVLPTEHFVKVHRSFIVSFSKIESITKEEVQIGTKSIPVSRSLANEVFKKVMESNILKR